MTAEDSELLSSCIDCLEPIDPSHLDEDGRCQGCAEQERDLQRLQAAADSDWERR